VDWSLEGISPAQSCPPRGGHWTSEVRNFCKALALVPVLPVASVASAEVRFQECHDFRFFQVLLDVAELLNLRAYARTYAA